MKRHVTIAFIALGLTLRLDLSGLLAASAVTGSSALNRGDAQL
jgi:hypothetical protein